MATGSTTAREPRDITDMVQNSPVVPVQRQESDMDIFAEDLRQHHRPAAPQVESLRHDLQTVYGQLLHAEHAAETDHAVAEASAYHHATTLLAGLLWSDAA